MVPDQNMVGEAGEASDKRLLNDVFADAGVSQLGLDKGHQPAFVASD